MLLATIYFHGAGKKREVHDAPRRGGGCGGLPSRGGGHGGVSGGPRGRPPLNPASRRFLSGGRALPASRGRLTAPRGPGSFRQIAERALGLRAFEGVATVLTRH